MRTGQVIGERFEIERRVAAGGMGQIFRAKDRSNGNLVALKVMLEVEPTHTRRFVRESDVLADLRHPAIVKFVADGVTDTGMPYLVMEWLDGEDLSIRLKRGPLDMHQALILVEHVAEALGFAHSRDIVHRDLKPSNLFLVGGEIDKAKVIDFGIAAISGATRLTRSGALRLAQAEAHNWRGELSLSKERALEAAKLFVPGTVSWFRAFQQAFDVAGKQAEIDRIETWVDLVMSTEPEPEAITARTVCLSVCANHLIYAGRYQMADNVIADLQNSSAAAVPNAQVAAMVHQLRVIRASSLGDPCACRDHLQASLSSFEQAGDRRNACLTRQNLGFVLAELGD